MIRNGNNFILDSSDVESAVMQFICSCYPDVSIDHVISVYNQSGCVAVACNSKTAPQIIEEAGKHSHNIPETLL